MQSFYKLYDSLTDRLRSSTDWLWPILLRAILFYEFFFPGMGKLRGENWFSGINDKFPFPFNQFSPDLNWLVAGYGEVVFSILLLLGLFTRFAALSILVITGVAVAAVHWPESWNSLSQLWEGYGIKSSEAGNFKLPLLYALMLLPLIFHGGGKLSLDQLLLKLTGRATDYQPKADLNADAVMLAVLGIGLVWVMPKTGLALLITALALAVLKKFRAK
ncbi:MAG: DoxX family protein [Gammaproteobacteria bacterium]|nr:DoxX family protein [Gammaproteobacteria bacterium]